MLSLGKQSKIIRVSNAVAAGQTTITSSAVDTQGYGACVFLVLWGAITTAGVQSIKAQQSSDDGSADAYADLTGTSVSVSDSSDNKVTYLEILKPRERYLKCIVSRATQDSVVDGIVAILTNETEAPTTHATSVSGGETHLAPAEGTATA